MAPTSPENVGFLPRRIELGRGRSLTVRAAAADDVDALAALFDALDLDARYRRFFCAYRPPRDFLERLAHANEHGGFEVVAVAEAPDVPPALVAEAGYAALPNGDGELAVTVAAGWRGWLGPYLVDAVAEAAASRHVPNLEADVLVANGPMLAVLRHRGCVVMEHPDWSVVRLLVGTGAAATWPDDHDLPRVLVEGAAGHLQASEASRAGRVHVLACAGPRTGRGGSGQTCPALAGRPCPLAAGADLVVVGPSGEDDRWAALGRAHRSVHPGVPVCVVRPGTAAPLTVDGVPIDGVDTRDVMALLQRFVIPVAADDGGSVG